MADVLRGLALETAVKETPFEGVLTSAHVASFCLHPLRVFVRQRAYMGEVGVGCLRRKRRQGIVLAALL